MKIQLTVKETRKINHALATIMSAVEGVPFVGDHIKSSIDIGHRFTINPDGSSEIEFKEKIVTAFLDSGSEAFVESGLLIKTSYEKLRGIWQSFQSDMDDVEHSLLHSGKGFVNAEELAKANEKYGFVFTTATPRMVQHLKQMLQEADDDGDLLRAFMHQNGKIERIDYNTFARTIEIDNVPEHIRVLIALRYIKSGELSLSKAARVFKVSFQSLKHHLNNN
jgi:hypothetical protein